MRKIFRWLLLGVVVQLFGVADAFAWESLDVNRWLAEPGVKLVAVDFYATWCEPCNRAIPSWTRLQKRYRSRGLRVVVVSVQSDGRCISPEWTPDKVVCDYEGDIARQWKASDLPQSFLWDWQGNLLVAHGTHGQVEKAVARYMNDLPRVLVGDPTFGPGVKVGSAQQRELKHLVRGELRRNSKFDIVADEQEARKLSRLRKSMNRAAFDEAAQCSLGRELPANSWLNVSVSSAGSSMRLSLELFSLEKSCLVGAGHAPIMGQDYEAAVVEAVAKLVSGVSGSAQPPGKETQANFQEAPLQLVESAGEVTQGPAPVVEAPPGEVHEDESAPIADQTDSAPQGEPPSDGAWKPRWHVPPLVPDTGVYNRLRLGVRGVLLPYGSAMVKTMSHSDSVIFDTPAGGFSVFSDYAVLPFLAVGGELEYLYRYRSYRFQLCVDSMSRDQCITDPLQQHLIAINATANLSYPMGLLTPYLRASFGFAFSVMPPDGIHEPKRNVVGWENQMVVGLAMNLERWGVFLETGMQVNAQYGITHTALQPAQEASALSMNEDFYDINLMLNFGVFYYLL